MLRIIMSKKIFDYIALSFSSIQPVIDYEMDASNNQPVMHFRFQSTSQLCTTRDSLEALSWDVLGLLMCVMCNVNYLLCVISTNHKIIIGYHNPMINRRNTHQIFLSEKR